MGSIDGSRRIPGPTSFWEVVVIPPERLFFRKVFKPSAAHSLHTDNRGKWQSGPGATVPFFGFGSRNKACGKLATQVRFSLRKLARMDALFAAADSALRTLFAKP